MFESVIAHITKNGYDLISKVLAGTITLDEFKINKVAFGGASSPLSLTPYNPSILDTDIPNHVIEITDDNITKLIDPVDGLLVVRVTVDSSQYTGYLNSVGVFVNDTLLACNSLMITHIQNGTTLTFDIKIPFIPDTIAKDQVNITQSLLDEAGIYSFVEFSDVKTMAKIPSGYEGVFYQYSLATSSVWCYATLKVESVTPLPIDYIVVAPTSLNIDPITFASDFILSQSSTAQIDFTIPIPFKEFAIACKASASDVYYSIDIRGLRRIV